MITTGGPGEIDTRYGFFDDRMNHRKRVFVTDFDGTVTGQDFYELVARRYFARDTPDYWGKYARGELTHFQAMRSFFSHAPEDAPSLDRLLDQMEPDPDLADAMTQLREHGWEVLIASAGSSWYIDRILARAGISGIAVHANPGTIEPGRGLWISLPEDSPFFSREVGIDKKAIVQDALSRADMVAFAGDGPPDLGPALLVDASLRFARGWLAAELRHRGEGFRPYERWSEVARELASS
jgi:2-hydroxy-3-keto-5-methylthiopentenyl-1-phosphate phosphatase